MKYVFFNYFNASLYHTRYIDTWKKLCDENGVQGYPTIKYYQNGVEYPYTGGRSFGELSAFVTEYLVEKCDIHKKNTNCSSKARKYIDKWSIESVDTVKSEIQRLEGMKNAKLTHELKVWLRERMLILAQIIEKDESEL